MNAQGSDNRDFRGLANRLDVRCWSACRKGIAAQALGGNEPILPNAAGCVYVGFLFISCAIVSLMGCKFGQ